MTIKQLFADKKVEKILTTMFTHLVVVSGGDKSFQASKTYVKKLCKENNISFNEKEM